MTTTPQLSENGSAADRASRGASFLDRMVPDWADQIDLLHLDLGDCYDCILGQIYSVQSDDNGVSGFYIGISILDLNQDRLINLGFDRKSIWDKTGMLDLEISYDELAVAWKDEIRNRRARAIA